MGTEETLHGLLEKTVALHSNKVAVIEDDGSSRSELAYQDLWDISTIVSETLRSFDLKSSQASLFISVCLEQCLVFPAILVGVLREGFGFACLDSEWSSEKRLDYLRKLQTPLLIHSSEEDRSGTNYKCCRIEVRGISLYFQRLEFPVASRVCPHLMAYAILTSGSTGQPKFVRVPHSSIVPNILSLGKYLNVSCADIIFLSSPSTFDPSIVDIFLAFSNGASLLVTQRAIKASSSSLLRILFPGEKSNGVSILQMTPSLFNRWSEKELKSTVFDSKTSLRVLLLGGEPFPSTSKLERCKGVKNCTQVFNIYGVTEVSAWASIHEVTLSSSSTGDICTNHIENSVPLGQPLSDTLFQVRDCSTGSVIKNGSGEVFIGSSTRICEIDNENCLEFCPPIYRSSGDIVQVHPDGKIYYVGRKDLTIKRWGHRVSLENIELIAMSHPGVRTALCIWDEVNNKLSLIVALDKFLSLSTLRRYFLQHTSLEKALTPDEILQIEEFSLTQHGKIDRQRALELIKKQIISLVKTFNNESFIKICKDILGLESLGEGSFLDLGGNSLLAVMLTTQLETAYGIVPDDLPSLLLSGETLQFIFARLAKFYEEGSEHKSVDDHPPAMTASVLPEIQEEATRDEEEADQLVFYSIRGKSNFKCFLSCNMYGAPLNNLTLSESWCVDLRKCIDASPLCVVYKSGDIGIVIGSHSGIFIFLDGITGKPRWSLNLPDRIESSACPSACGKYVYAGCYNGALYCVNTYSGRIKWSYSTGGMIKCTAALCNGNKSIIFGSYDSKVYCVNAESGQLEWSNCWGDSGSWIASPLVVKDIAVLCSLACKAYGVRTEDGSVVWKIQFQHPIFSSPCHLASVTENFVCMAEVKGTIHCLKLSSGEKVAMWTAPGLIFAPLTEWLHSYLSQEDHQPRILVPCYDQNLYCLLFNSENNQMCVEWKSYLGATIGSAPFVFGLRTGKVCAAVINSTGKVFIISLEDGSVVCHYSVHAEVFSSPVLYEDQMYFGCRDNNLYSLKIKCQY